VPIAVDAHPCPLYLSARRFRHADELPQRHRRMIKSETSERTPSPHRRRRIETSRPSNSCRPSCGFRPCEMGIAESMQMTTDDAELPERISQLADMLMARSLTLAVAESLTGGMLTSHFAAGPNAAKWLRGSRGEQARCPRNGSRRRPALRGGSRPGRNGRRRSREPRR
jgi:hypothetical protein